VLSSDDVTNVVQSEIIPVTGEGYDVMLDIIFPKGYSHSHYYIYFYGA